MTKIQSKSLGNKDLAVAGGPLRDALVLMTNSGYQPITIPQYVELMIATGLPDAYDQFKGLEPHGEGPMVAKEGVVYIPWENEFYLSRNLPVWKNPWGLWDSPKRFFRSVSFRQKAYELHGNEVDVALKGAIRFPQTDEENAEYTIPPAKFGDSELTSWLFGGDILAKRVGEFMITDIKCRGTDYSGLKVSLIQKGQWESDAPVATQIYMPMDLGHLYGNIFPDIIHPCWAGVLGIKSGNPILPSNLKINEIIEVLKQVREGNIPNSKLENIVKQVDTMARSGK